MAGEIQHSLIPLVNNHKHYRWIVEDEIEKNTIVPLSTDEDKIMLVKDGNKEYRLTNISPVQWQRVSANPDELTQGLSQKVDKVEGKGLIEDVPNDGHSYVRKNGEWVRLTWGNE